MCGDPTLQSASTICCSTDSKDETRAGVLNFSKEKVTLEEAERRCREDRPADTSNQLCTDPYVAQSDCQDPDSLEGGCDRYHTAYWTSRNCTLKVKIDFEGSVAIVHDVEYQPKEMVKHNTPVFFPVDWVSDEQDISNFLGNYSTSCASMGCEETLDGYCICDVDVDESIAFDDDEIQSASVGQVLARATFGGILPSDKSDFNTIGDIKYYPSGNLTDSTVFEITDPNGIVQYRKNKKSQVSFGELGNSLTFRNPVQFVSIAIPEVRDVQYELDAALEQYLYHHNTAPFLAIRFAQRFGISNPSPRYVYQMASAFRSGTYTYGEKTFGSGVYGDLEAMMAALILDRESESVVLDADPVQ